MKSKNSREDLGQVFTPSNIAELMILLLMKKGRGKENGKDILDPCIGKNIFFNTLQELFPENNYIFHGVEIDNAVVTKNLQSKKQKLFIKNFFDFPVSKKYDYIIMNPPYVRHEILSQSVDNNKNEITKKIAGLSFEMGKKSNLFIYFFVKALAHLKKNGKIVAICYDSWMYTKYGVEFKKFLNQNFEIKTIIHFKHTAFDNADVGATILELVKTENVLMQNEDTLKIEIESKEHLPNLSNFADLKTFLNAKNLQKKSKGIENDFLMENIVDRFDNLRRGIETPGNKYFFISDEVDALFKRKILSNIKGINGFSAHKSEANEILYIDRDEKLKIDPKTKKYLLSVKKSVLNTDGYLTLKRMIGSQKKDWFFIKKVKPGNIIFNYYIRNRADFILNKEEILVSNNFYLLDSKDMYLDLALLNSTRTKKSVFANSRQQGKGLRKLQLYEFKKVKMFNCSKFSTSQKKEIRLLGKQLSECERGSGDKIIKKIDTILDNILAKS